MKEVLMVGIFSMMITLLEMWLWSSGNTAMVFTFHTVAIVSLFYIAGGKK